MVFYLYLVSIKYFFEKSGMDIEDPTEVHSVFKLGCLKYSFLRGPECLVKHFKNKKENLNRHKIIYKFIF